MRRFQDMNENQLLSDLFALNKRREDLQLSFPPEIGRKMKGRFQ